MRDKFNKYWDAISKFNLMMYFATIFDPRMKMHIVTVGYTKIYDLLKDLEIEETNNQVAKKMEKKVEKDFVKPLESLFGHFISKCEIPISNVQQERGKKVPIDDEGGNEFLLGVVSSDDCGVSDTKKELKYLDEPREPGLGLKDFHILNWWKVNSPRFPILTTMARGNYILFLLFCLL